MAKTVAKTIFKGRYTGREIPHSISYSANADGSWKAGLHIRGRDPFLFGNGKTKEEAKVNLMEAVNKRLEADKFYWISLLRFVQKEA